MATGMLNTRPWKAASRQYRQRHPVCESCRRSPAVMVGHSVSPQVAPHRLLDDANLTALCRPCFYAERDRVLLA
jgi:5-methylcytosine-specific restriction endonuclease McrA